ncbi:LysR family transcriptional regulator [Rhizobium sp. S152]|uniref:LysR family transcriptional regulator n=1 Tax=Rhizobium sp. S152 TaxID=3055038 RepID=UPI0025A9A350|nr:LysR family transcriptional regulator [Rhizobium sp. S152]MDM9628501.1 LysR family transcriptional regulator [Rhizobium sp. S152]
MVEMNDQLHALRLFVRVARAGSFSRAAKELNLSQPTASRIIANLEHELGTTLLTRTTRAVTLTEVGREYLDRVLPILDALEEADNSVRSGGGIRGSVRVGSSSSLASRVLVPLLSKFTQEFSAISVDLVIDDKRQDLIGEGVDVALRSGRLTDSSAVARRLGRWPLLLVASPDYIMLHGDPATPSELVEHNAIVAGPLGATWTFTRDGEEIPVKLRGRLAISSSEVAVNAALAGVGMAVGSLISFQPFLSEGRLVRLLPDWSLGEIDIHALYPSSQSAKPAAKAFTEFLVKEMRSLREL